jgi:hypothetical protein
LDHLVVVAIRAGTAGSFLARQVSPGRDATVQTVRRCAWQGLPAVKAMPTRTSGSAAPPSPFGQ